MSGSTTREEWLRQAVRMLRALIKEHGEDLPAEWDVSVAEPHRKVIGRAWPSGHIFVMGHLVEPVQVLATVLHEMIHIAVGLKEKHKGKFKTLARAVGLEGKLTATFAKEGTPLHARLTNISKALGHYPHRQMLPTTKAGSGGGGWLRFASNQEPAYKVLVSPKQLELHGAPRDPFGEEMRECA